MHLFPVKDSDCELFTISDFQEMVFCGAITDDDGSAYWADSQCYAHEHPVDTEKSFEETKPDWATHVAWFNR